jgi:hypothetical protein
MTREQRLARMAELNAQMILNELDTRRRLKPKPR